MGHVTEVFEGWVPGPNPFGNQRAESTNTWYRPGYDKHGTPIQLEVRMDYVRALWVISRSYRQADFSRPGQAQWGLFRCVTTQGFDSPAGAMLWYELNKEDL